MRDGAIIAERFEIEAVAGRGGMGTVFRARERGSSELVAVKIVDPTHANARFEQEADLLARLSDENIVRYVAHGAIGDGRMYLAMEWLDGAPLDGVIADGPLPIADAIEVALRVARALASAHRIGVVHRDVKPSNVILRGGSARAAVLVDFGIARATNASYAMTATGAVIGTPAYMAPEQARGERADARADVFSLGCVLFECLAGRPAFVGEHAIAVLAKILLEPAPDVKTLRSEVPERLRRLVASMLEKDPAARPASADAVVEELDAIASGKVLLGKRITAPEPSIGASERRFVTVIFARRPGTSAAADAAYAATEAALVGLTDEAAVADRAATYGVTLTALADGTLLGAVVAESAGADAAERAVRCALSISADTEGATIALATGRAIVDGALPFGEAIDRAASVFAARSKEVGTKGGVYIDEATASIAESRFDLTRTGGAILVVAERAPGERIRTVMGRVVPFVGRDREIALLESTFAECVDEPVARAVLAIAEPGVGKSRLQREVTARVAQEHPAARVWLGLADPLIQSAPFALAGDLLRRALAIRAGDPLEARRDRIRARVKAVIDATVVPSGASVDVVAESIAQLLGEICETPFDDASAPALRAARSSPMLMAARIEESFVAYAIGELRKAPLLLILEDVHWADAGSLRLVTALLARAKDLPLLVFGLARPTVDTAHPKLWEEAMCQRLLLGPLLKKASAAIARAVLGDRPEIDAIVARSGGNALFVEELTRACALQGCAPKSCACATDVVDELPPTILAATEARLGSLHPESRKLLRAASIFGERFWESGVAALVGEAKGAGPQVQKNLARLESIEILSVSSTSRFADEREWVFRHALVRDTAYAMLTPDDRRIGHALAADWLAPRVDDAALLGQHYELGEKRDQAAAAYTQATEDALAANDPVTFAAHAAKARACGAHGALLGRLLLSEAESSFWRGDNAAAAKAGRDALTLLERGSVRWFQAIAIASAAVGKCMDVEALDVLVAQLEATPATDPSTGRARAVARVRAAMQLLYMGRPAIANAMLDDCESEPGAAGDPAVMAWLADAEFERAFASGRLVHPNRCLAARDLQLVIGDRRAAIMAAGLRVTDLMMCGAHEEAAADAKALETNNDASASPYFVKYLTMLTEAFSEARRGNFDGLTRALEAAIGGGSPRARIANLIWLASMLLEGGRVEEGAGRIDRILANETLPPVFDCSAYAVASLAASMRGDAKRALDLAMRGRDAEACGVAAWAKTVLDYAWVRALDMNGRHEEARVALAEGLASLRARAAPLGEYGARYCESWFGKDLMALER